MFDNSEIVRYQNGEYMPVKGGNSFWDRITRIIRPAIELSSREEIVTTGDQEAFEKFIAILSHELKGNFSTILMCVESIEQKRDANPTEDMEFYIDTIKSIAKEALNMLHNMITTVAFNHGKLYFNTDKRKVHLSDFIYQFKDLIMNHGNLKNESLEIKVNNAIPETIFLDSSKLYSVIKNLIINAYQNKKSESVVVIECEWNSGLNLKVTNEGETITLEEISKIFTPFYKNSLSTGSGIGLYLSKLYMTLLGGDIEVISQDGINEFRIFIPHDHLINSDD